MSESKFPICSSQKLKQLLELIDVSTPTASRITLVPNPSPEVVTAQEHGDLQPSLGSSGVTLPVEASSVSLQIEHCHCSKVELVVKIIIGPTDPSVSDQLY